MSDVDHVEQHVGSIRSVGQIAYFVHDEDTRVRVGNQRLMQVSFLTRVRKIFDQFSSRGKQGLETVLDGSIPNGHRQVCLSSTSLSMQDQRAPFSDEVWPQVGTQQRFPKFRLLSEIEFFNRLEEGKVRVPRAALQTCLLPLLYFLLQ